MQITHYFRLIVSLSVTEQLEFSAPLSYQAALAKVNEWNKSSAHNNKGNYLYWI